MPAVSKPRETLSVVDAIAIIVGIVVGVGIFKKYGQCPILG